MGATEDAASRRPAPNRDLDGHGVRSSATRLRRVAEEEFLLVVLLAMFGAVFVAVFPPTLLVADTWMTLVAGREVAEHGLPSRDELTVLAFGRDWTDQQWGAQLLAYRAHQLGGHALLAVATGAFAVGAFAIAAVGARRLGAGPRAIVLVFFPVLVAAPWAWTMRAQVFALPLFTGLLWLLASESRRPSRRAYLAFPILVVWANIHGTVALAALLTMLLGASELVRSRGRSGWRSVVLLVLPPLAVLATPYGPLETARYYYLLLVDPPFPRELVTEWRASDPGTDTALFYVLAAVALVVVVLGRRRLTLFDQGTLALTFVGALTAIRGIPWFALACLVLLPVALGRRLEGREPARRPRRLDGVLSLTAVAALAAAVVLAFAREESWYVEKWPEDAVAAIETEATSSDRRVFSATRYADWLLWRVPELRGRISHDVRFELFDRGTFERIVRFKGQQGADWKSIADGFEVVVLETGTRSSSQVPDFLAEPGAVTLYQDPQVTVIRRAPS
jgi:hypothetical protein